MTQPDKIINQEVLRPVGQTALLSCGILGPLIFLIVYFTFGSVSPDFDMMRQPIGRLELMDYGWIQSANFIVYGLFTCAFAVGLRNELQSGPGVILLPLLQVFAASGMIMLGIFIHEPVHTYVSIFLTVSLVAGFWLFARRFAGNPQWKRWVVSTNLCAFSMIMLSVLYWYAHHVDSPIAGIFEHLLIAVRMVWLVVFILKLLWGSSLAEVEGVEESPYTK
ncbi:MAG TPA: DUF998 domain-containing protein [Mucilaginibacter sp.]|jgi:hypothetical protein|nr:DUF998 domain-containing protein [Mucilaginibacter sp.]